MDQSRRPFLLFRSTSSAFSASHTPRQSNDIEAAPSSAAHAVHVRVAACAAGAAVALLVVALLAGMFQPPWRRPLGGTTAANATELFLRERGPLYLHAAQRCRPPREGEAVPQLQLVASWGGAASVAAEGQQQQQQQHRSGQEGRAHVTLVTQLSMDRLGPLQQQCRSWAGQPLAAAVYLPLTGSPQSHSAAVEGAKQQLGSLHELMAAEGACDLQLQLFSEHAAGTELYPSNALMNRALSMADTEAVLLADVDFLVSRQLSEEAGTSSGWANMQQQLAAAPALVLPAFQPSPAAGKGEGVGRGDIGGLRTNSSESGLGVAVSNYSSGSSSSSLEEQVAWSAVRGGNQVVVDLVGSGKLVPFRAKVHGKAEDPSRHSAWLTADGAYPANYTHGYAPVVLMLREQVPWFDERLRGPRYGKAVQFTVMWQWGVRFWVHPQLFAVHLGGFQGPASPRPAQAQQATQGGVEGEQALLDQVKEDLEKHRYYPVKGFGDSCLLQPQDQPRRRNRIYIRSH